MGYRMKSDNIFFINGTAYAGKSTMVKRLAQKFDGIACEENYHEALLSGLDKDEFPCLTYTRDLQDWHDFIRRTPDEYAAWIRGVSKKSSFYISYSWTKRIPDWQWKISDSV